MCVCSYLNYVTFYARQFILKRHYELASANQIEEGNYSIKFNGDWIMEDFLFT